MLWLSQNFLLYQTIITKSQKFSQCQYFFNHINIEKISFFEKSGRFSYLQSIIINERMKSIFFSTTRFSVTFLNDSKCFLLKMKKIGKFGLNYQRHRALFTNFLTPELTRKFCNPLDDWLD